MYVYFMSSFMIMDISVIIANISRNATGMRQLSDI